MMNYYRHIDRSKVQFDFLVHDAGGNSYYDEEIKAMGGQIYRLPQKSKNPYKYNKELKEFFANSEYRIIHTHMDAMGAWVLKAAKKAGVPVRIAHSHNTKHLTTNPLKLFVLECARKQINHYATHRMACSAVAGKWLFRDYEFQIIRNAIEADKYKFDESIRNEGRRKWNIENNFVIGHVGRFDYQKNHSFLLDVFAEVHRKQPQAKLMLLGDGHLKEKIIGQIKKMHIEEAVILTGVRDDVEYFYNTFDLFVLPSLFEGLGIVAIEAQMNGCPSLLSDQVPTEVKITDKIDFLTLNKDSWVEHILRIILEKPQRMATKLDSKSLGYNIEKKAIKLQNFYLNL
jgi:glycosyltransferase involved in cell wall biosynthesis